MKLLFMARYLLTFIAYRNKGTDQEEHIPRYNAFVGNLDEAKAVVRPNSIPIAIYEISSELEYPEFRNFVKNNEPVHVF